MGTISGLGEGVRLGDGGGGVVCWGVWGVGVDGGSEPASGNILCMPCLDKCITYENRRGGAGGYAGYGIA